MIFPVFLFLLNDLLRVEMPFTMSEHNGRLLDSGQHIQSVSGA